MDFKYKTNETQVKKIGIACKLYWTCEREL